MSKLSDLIWTEKFRPKTINDLIFENKNLITNFIHENNSKIPSLLLYSSKPGTGKTTTARLISSAIGADLLSINASDERGIDTIRDKIKLFAQSMSSLGDIQRCVFLDEADGLTKIAQESMKALMELYSTNCFFILSCNDISKIIEPIRKGRCLTIDFSKPPKDQILKRLQYICKIEGFGDNNTTNFSEKELNNLIESEYPDIRSMILALQTAKIEGNCTLVDVIGYSDFMKAIRDKNIQYIYTKVYSGKFDMHGFVRYYFQKLFDAADKVPLEKISRVALLLADIEKNWAIGVNLEIVFLSNILEIIRGS